MTPCTPGGFDNLLIGCIRIAEFNVVLYCIMEKIDVLENHRNVFYQAVGGAVLYVLATDKHLAGLYIPEPGDKVAQRCLAAAGRPYNRTGAALWNSQGNIVDDDAVI
jgi:hypothetical protein